jgi:hypothetical protein
MPGLTPGDDEAETHANQMMRSELTKTERRTSRWSEGTARLPHLYRPDTIARRSCLLSESGVEADRSYFLPAKAARNPESRGESPAARWLENRTHEAHEAYKAHKAYRETRMSFAKRGEG